MVQEAGEEDRELTKLRGLFNNVIVRRRVVELAV
jgi:hypothetical protein